MVNVHSVQVVVCVYVHGTSCNAVCHVFLGYIVLELATASLFLAFCCAVGYMAGITIKVCALSLYILIV